METRTEERPVSQLEKAARAVVAEYDRLTEAAVVDGLYTWKLARLIEALRAATPEADTDDGE